MERGVVTARSAIERDQLEGRGVEGREPGPRLLGVGSGEGRSEGPEAALWLAALQLPIEATRCLLGDLGVQQVDGVLERREARMGRHGTLWPVGAVPLERPLRIHRVDVDMVERGRRNGR